MSVTSAGRRVARGFVDVENFLGRLLGTRGVRTVGGGERQSFQSLTGLDGIGDADSVSGEFDHPCRRLYRLK